METQREADPKGDTVLCIGPTVEIPPLPEAEPERMRVIPFEEYARDMDLLGCMIDEHVIETSDTPGLAIFIHNRGGPEARAEGLLALLPVARKLYERIRSAVKNEGDEGASEGT